MRKIKLFLSLLMVMLLSVGNVWGETVTYTVTSKTAVNTSGTAPDGSSASLVVNNGSNAKEQLTSGNTMTLTLSGYAGYKITAISLSMKSNSSKGAGSFEAVAGTTTIFSIADSKFNTANWNGAWSTSYVNITPATDDDDYEILENEDVVMTITASANSIYCQSFTITYEDASSTCETLAAPTNPSSTPAQTSVELNWDAVANASGYKVVFNGTDYDIASGTTKTIENLAMETEYHWTVAAKGDGTTYCPAGTATAQQSVTTLDACTANKVVYTVASTSSVTPSGALEGSSATFANTYNTKDQVTSGNSQTLTLSGYDGATIKGLTLNMHSNASKGAGTFSLVIGSTTVAEISTATNFNAWFDNDSYGVEYRNVHVPFAKDVVVGTEEDIKVTIAATTNSLFCQSFSFCYDEPAPVAVEKPAFDLATGTYLGAQSVGITCATDGAEIFYTLDGTDPSSASTPYSNAISITETKTLKAIAIKGNDKSAIATATYTIINTEHAGTSEDPYSVADAKAVIDGIGTKADAYVSGKISQVDSYDSNHKSITYWISADGTTSGQQLQVYSGKGLSGADFSSVDDVVAKAIVVVKGTLKKYNSTYEFDYNNQLVSYEAPAEPIVTLSPSSLNLEAGGNGTQEITLTATNFGNEVNEITCAFYNTAACDGEAISQPAWITNLTDNNSNQVSFDVEDNDGEARQVWMKVTASDGTNEAYAVLAIAQAKYTVDYATLPFEFDGGRADIENKNGMTQNGLGTDYNNSPKLKFDGTGDCVVIKINNTPGTLTYDIKGNSFSGSTFTVQKSEDGTNYTDIKTYTALGDKQNESIDNIGQAIRYVKFIYTEKVQNGGNVALGNITISEYVAPVVKPTITTQPEGAEYTINDPAAALTIVAEAGNGGTLHYQWYSNTTQSTEGASTIGTDAATYTPSTDALGTIYYYCVVAEDGADEPTTSNIVAVAVSESMPATVTYELFSGDLVEGDYVIYYSDGAMNTTVDNDRLQYAEVTPAEDKITNPDASIIWHIAQSGEYWTIYNSAADSYAASTGAKNKAQMLADGTDDKALWTVSGDATYEFVNKQNTTNGVNANLRKNGTYGFACYSSTQSGTGPLTLYKKKIEGQPATPTFSISGGTYTSAQEVTISCATEEVAIYYTTDGITNPTSESTLYEGPISVNETMTIKAIAIKNEIASDVASATYTIVAIEHAGTEDDPYTIADARNAILVGGDLSEKYVSGIISQIDSYSSQYHSITYWISDDGETTSPQLQVYSGKGLNGADFSSVDDVVAKATVVVKGTLKKYNSTYEFDYNNQLVSYSAPVEPVVTLKQSGSTVTVLNLEATSVANQAIDVECANFADAISSVTAELYEESTCDTKITSGAWVTDITVNGTSQVTFNVADNAGEARQVWLKVTASDGSNDAFAVLNIKQAKYTVDYAELPFAFDGGKNDVANTNGMTHSGLGSDYSASPKLKFDHTDDYLIIKINEDPGTLTYDIKGNGFSGGTFKVQQSSDGVDYSDVVTYTELSDKQSETKTLAQTTRYIKFIYTAKDAGNVALGKITISKYEAPDYGSYERNGLTAGNYATICLPNGGTISGATLFDLDYYDGANTLYLLEVNGNAMVAGRPYIFLPEANEITVTYTNDANASAGSFNGLVGSYSQQNVNEIAGENYILYQNAYYLVNSTAYVGANRAYIHMDGVPTEPSTPQVGQAPRRRVTMAVHGEQVATGMENLNASKKPVKLMIDGNIYIIRGEKLYDATGRLVK